MGLLPQGTATDADGGPEIGTFQSRAASPALVRSLLLAGLSLGGKGRENILCDSASWCTGWGWPFSRAGSCWRAPHFLLFCSLSLLSRQGLSLQAPLPAANLSLPGEKRGIRQSRLWDAAWTLALPPSWALPNTVGAAAALAPRSRGTSLLSGVVARRQKAATQMTHQVTSGVSGREEGVPSSPKR